MPCAAMRLAFNSSHCTNICSSSGINHSLTVNTSWCLAYIFGTIYDAHMRKQNCRKLIVNAKFKMEKIISNKPRWSVEKNYTTARHHFYKYRWLIRNKTMHHIIYSSVGRGRYKQKLCLFANVIDSKLFGKFCFFVLISIRWYVLCSWQMWIMRVVRFGYTIIAYLYAMPCRSSVCLLLFIYQKIGFWQSHQLNTWK